MKKVLSIEITDSVTRVCEMSEDKKIPVVCKSVIFANPDGTVEDGMIGNTVVYGKELTKQLKNAQIKTRRVIFVYSSNKIMSREVTVPDMKPEKIDALIENERATYFPMDTSDHKFTYYVIERLKESKQLRIMIYAVPKEMIANYKILANDLGMYLVRLDCSGNTIANWLLKPDCKDMSFYLEINERNSVFTIINKGMMALQRNMNFGYKNVERLTEITPTMIRPLTANIANVLEYYNTRNRDAEVSKIHVGGVGSRIPGLKALMESEFLGIEVELVDRLPGVRISRKDSYTAEHSTELIACLGTAASQINFNYGEEDKRVEKTLIRCIMAAILVTIASGLIIINGQNQYEQAVSRQNQLKKELAELEAVNVEAVEYDYIATDDAVTEVVNMDASTVTYNERWNEILAALEEACVSDMAITSINSGESTLSMSISVSSKEEAAKMIMQLQDLSYEDGSKIFTSVSTSAISEGTGYDDDTLGKVVSFSVVCNYEEPAEESESSDSSYDSLRDLIELGISGSTATSLDSDDSTDVASSLSGLGETIASGLADSVVDAVNSSLSGDEE